MTRPQPLIQACALFVLCVLCMAQMGCGKTLSFEDWQRGVEEYVWTGAGGDPNRLRDLSLGIPGSDHRGYAIVSAELPRESSDVRGVLLGMKPFAGKPRMVFLVGLVKKQRVRDIRMAAMAFEGEAFDWVWGADDSAALAQYREGREAAWERVAGDDADTPAAYRTFPGVDDVFKLEAAGGRLTATHLASGATWTLAPPSP